MFDNDLLTSSLILIILPNNFFELLLFFMGLKRVKSIGLDFNDRSKRIKYVLERRQPSLTVVIENVHDPHNVSAVIRTCDAVGIYDVNFIYHSGQSFPVLYERSSASARKWIIQNHYESVGQCFSKLHSQNKKIITSTLSADSISLYDLNLTEPTALVFGNEHSGVSQEALDLADGNFKIPQVGMIQSLNISVACAVSLYEALRQRQKNGMYDNSQFPEDFLNDEIQRWLIK